MSVASEANGVLARLLHLEVALHDLWERGQEESDKDALDIASLAVLDSRLDVLADEVKALKRAAWGFAASFMIGALTLSLAITQIVR